MSDWIKRVLGIFRSLFRLPGGANSCKLQLACDLLKLLREGKRTQLKFCTESFGLQ